MKPASALRLLHWAVLVFVLMGLGRACAQETHRLDLDQTRAALTAAENALRGGNLDDADLQRLRAQSDALALALQGAVAALTPRLAASTQRLDRTHAQIGRSRADDRRRGQGAREREAKARQARRQPARRPRHAAGSRRSEHAHQRRAAPVVCAANLRPLVERPQSAALGGCLAGSAGRRRGDAGADRQLARRGRRTADARQDRAWRRS